MEVPGTPASLGATDIHKYIDKPLAYNAFYSEAGDPYELSVSFAVALTLRATDCE